MTRSTAYRSYLLGVLMVILACNYVDRVALGVMLQDIKADLALSDTELGLLSGIAFALFYSVMGIPIARWADRGNRILIIALTSVLWSGAVALCGLATSFTQLLLIRIAVAVGEAGCAPAGLSLIADYFSRSERPRAVAIYGLGGALSGVVGYLVAGWLNQLYGWRFTFLCLGLPGLLLAALVWFTLEEPRVRESRMSPPASLWAHPIPQPSIFEVCRILARDITFRHLLLCLSLNFFFGYGIGQWLPTFLVRSYGLATGQIGTSLAVITGLAGLVGTYLCGDLASRYAPNNERLQLRAMAGAIAVAGILAICAYLSSNLYVALILIGLFCVGLTTLNGPLVSTIQTLVPAHMRAVSFAVVYMVANLIGMGFGPLASGALSDALRPWAGEESLRYGLLLLSPGYFWCAWHAWRASATVMGRLAETQLAHERERDSSQANVAEHEDLAVSGSRENYLQATVRKVQK